MDICIAMMEISRIPWHENSDDLDCVISHSTPSCMTAWQEYIHDSACTLNDSTSDRH